jgi:hypothetical protein
MIGNEKQNRCIAERKSERQLCEDLDGNIEFEEVIEAIKRVKTEKAADIDEIRSEMMKYGGTALKRFIWLLFRDIWHTEKIPQEWEQNITVPIRKKVTL